MPKSFRKKEKKLSKKDLEELERRRLASIRTESWILITKMETDEIIYEDEYMSPKLRDESVQYVHKQYSPIPVRLKGFLTATDSF